MAYIWPVVLVVTANAVYHVCAKSVPESMNPFASLAVSYTLGAMLSAGLYLIMHRGEGFWREVGKINWASIVMGLAVVGMEVGSICTYRAGWQMSKASTVQSAVLAAVLLGVGALFFHETITLRKVAGLVVCLIGLIIINH